MRSVGVLPMTILDKFTYKPNKLSIDPDLRHLMITHIAHLRDHPTTTTVNIVKEELITHQYNLYAYLNKVRIEPKLHWVIFLINNIESPELFNKDLDVLLIPDISLVEDIVAMHS